MFRQRLSRRTQGRCHFRPSDHAKTAAIADVYDALTTTRPYSDARKPYQAVLLMKEEMVGHFAQEKFIRFIHFLHGASRKARKD